MLGFRTIAFVAVVAALIFSGVLDVSVHLEKLPAAPMAVMSFLKSKGIYEQGRALGVRAKRSGELFFAGSESDTIRLVLEYVDEDAGRLQELIADGETPKALLPQAELLVGSLEQAKEELRQASPETLAESKDRSREAIEQVAAAFDSVKAVSEEYESYQQQLAEVASSLERSKEILTESNTEPEGDVAGTEDEAEDKPVEESENSAIPLQF